MYSTVLSHPLHAEPTSDKHRKFSEADKLYETRASPANITGSLKSNRTLFSRNVPRNTDILRQESRLKKPKNGAKRGLDIGLDFRIPSINNKKLDNLEEILEVAKLNLEGVLNASACPNCDGEEDVFIPEKRRVKPAYECDEWDARYRLCILERNIGDTVTFYLSTGKSEERKLKVTWKKEFHMKDSQSRTGFVIDPDNAPENIIIGKQGYELRISPITETDIGYNLFSASLSGYTSPQSAVYFMIRIVPIDLGFVYVGETIELSLRSYISFPALSFSFIWYMEKYGEHSTLPSNMRTSVSGSSIKISELRQEQEGILACTMYTNLDFLATKKRFLMKDLVKNNDVLKSPPNHTLHFKEETPDRRKRFPIKLIRHKKDISAEDIEKVLKGMTSEEGKTTESKVLNTATHSYNDYNVGMDVGYPGSNAQFEDNFRGIKNKTGNGEALDHPVDISVENNPVDVEGIGINDQVINKYQDQRIGGIQGDSSMLKVLRTEKDENLFSQHPSEKVENIAEEMALPQNNLETDPELSAAQQSFLSDNIPENGKSLLDVEIQNEGEKYVSSPTEDSGIILNIERIRGPRRITAEQKISKLISSCLVDYECSGAATCVRSNLKQTGYCKCLPGFSGVGIFCREDVWEGKSNFGFEDFPNPNDIPNSNTLHTPQ